MRIATPWEMKSQTSDLRRVLLSIALSGTLALGAAGSGITTPANSSSNTFLGPVDATRTIPTVTGAQTTGSATSAGIPNSGVAPQSTTNGQILPGTNMPENAVIPTPGTSSPNTIPNMNPPSQSTFPPR